MSLETSVSIRDQLRDRTYRYASEVVSLYFQYSKDVLAQSIAKRFLHSGTSVGANFRQAYRAPSQAQFIATLDDCLKELDESLFWLQLSRDHRLLPDRLIEPLQREGAEILLQFLTLTNGASQAAQ